MKQASQGESKIHLSRKARKQVKLFQNEKPKFYLGTSAIRVSDQGSGLIFVKKIKKMLKFVSEVPIKYKRKENM